MPEPLSGAILVGGRSRRMGSDKALLRSDGEPLVARLVTILGAACDEVLLVGGDPTRFTDLGLAASWAPDAQEGVGPLGGILGALESARYEACLTVACDMPFITRELVAAMAAQPRDYRALAYTTDDLEPLLAIYTRACRAPLRAAIAERDLAARRFLDRIGAQSLPVEVLDLIDPDRRCATNINTPDDLAALPPFLIES